jgi:alpha-beta hydrolase superfamily lysophospholipase
VQRWDPDGAPKCVVIVCHGGAEHVGRYAPMAQRWNALGAVVISPDHRGQGRSGGSPGHVDHFAQYWTDLRELMDFLLDDESGPDSSLPWFIYGHSMGGLISRGLLQTLNERPFEALRGAVISAPLFGLAMKVNPIKQMLANMLYKLAPRFALDPGIPPNTISRDSAEVETYKSDDRRTKVVSAGWAHAMDEAIAEVADKLGSIQTPMYWYVGSGDLLCDHHATLAAFERLSEAAALDQSLRVFDCY